MVSEWMSVVGGMVVAVAGLGFSWHASRRSEAHGAELARVNNEHTRALTEMTFAHARELELMRHDQLARDQRRQRSAEAYEEIAETVIRASRELHDAHDARPGYPDGDGDDDGELPGTPDLTRALALVTLHASAEVRTAFTDWHDRFQKLAFAHERLHRSSVQERVWRHQVRDGSLHEIDARDRLLTAMTEAMAAD